MPTNHESYSDRVLREGRQRAKADAERRAEWEASGGDIPDLEFLTPDCSVCGQPTEYEEGYYCASCRIQWPRNGYGRKAERFTDERAAQVSTWQRCPICTTRFPSWAKRAQWEHVDQAHRDDAPADIAWIEVET